MGKRKPPQAPQTEHYKDVWRHFFVCDGGHRSYQDWDARGVVFHGRCPLPGCEHWTELDFGGPDTRSTQGGVEGDPIRLVEVPSDWPVQHWTEPDEANSRRSG